MDQWYNEGGALFPADFYDDPRIWVLWGQHEGIVISLFSDLSNARKTLLEKYPRPRYNIAYDSWASDLIEVIVSGENSEYPEYIYYLEYKRLDVWSW